MWWPSPGGKIAPMPLPTPAPRTHLHTRSVTYRGYHREDGLWDIEGEMTDTKTYPFTHEVHGARQPGTPMHAMVIRATVDDTLTIRAIASASDQAPFAECQQGVEPMQQMVGVQMGRGWRKAIEQALGKSRGCTHQRELLFNLATAAFQAVPHYRERVLRKATGEPTPERAEPPYYLGSCIAWDFNGPVVARHYPKFTGWQPVKRMDKID